VNNAGALLLILAACFGFLTGYHNSANIVATPIASRAIRPRLALIAASFGTFVGPFIFGTAVARTIGTSITDTNSLTIPVVSAGTAAAVLWGLLTWWRGIPSSSSHALIGGLVGAIFVSEGIDAIKLGGILQIALALLISPPLGFFVSYLLMRVTIFLARGARQNINLSFKRGQLLSAFTLALSHGTNDGQKVMAIIGMGLVAGQGATQFTVPLWVTLLSAAAVALGTASGGWRLIRTLGYRIYKVRPVHGFVAQMSATAVILGASVTGGPVSTTQVVSSAIMGAGASERLSKVRWQVVHSMLLAWVLTVPVSFMLGAGLVVGLQALVGP
jgi:PiT family inorganic phosphate transporter